MELEAGMSGRITSSPKRQSDCVCGEPAGDAFLGKRCAERLERALGDLPALIEDLDITLTRQSVIGAHSDGGKPAKKDAQPLSLHIAAAEVASDLRYKLATSIRYLTEARGITDHGPWCLERTWQVPFIWHTCGGCAQPKDNPTSMARWLLRHRDSIRLDPAGPDIASDIHAITASIMEVVDLPKTRGRFKVGMCPEESSGVLNPDGTTTVIYCVGEIWAVIPAEDLGQLATMECRSCGKVYETWQWHRAGARILKRGAA
jgi:hypothetical protein